MTEQLTVVKPRILSIIHTPCQTPVEVDISQISSSEAADALAKATRDHCKICEKALEVR